MPGPEAERIKDQMEKGKSDDWSVGSVQMEKGELDDWSVGSVQMENGCCV